MKEKIQAVARMVALATLLLGTSAPLSANELTKFTTVCNTDFASVGVGGMMNLGVGHIALTNPVPVGSVKKALLYWHGQIGVLSGGQPDPNGITSTAALNGVAVNGTGIGFSSENGWAGLLQASQAARADVTAIVNGAGAGTYLFTGVTNISGASLLVFYDDGNPNNNRDVIIYDGNDSNSPSRFDADGWNVNFTGFIYGSGAASLQLHVSDGQSYQERDLLLNGETFVPGPNVFSGNTVPAEANLGTYPPILGLRPGDTALWDITTYDIVNWLTPGLNNLFFTTDIRQDFFSLIVALINVPAGAAVDCGATPPPVSLNHPPGVSCSAPMVVEANATTGLAAPVINALVTDEDGDALLVIWKTNGTPVQTVNIPATGSPISTNLSISKPFVPRANAYQTEITVSDGIAAPVTCTTSITIIEPVPPVVACGAPHTVYTVQGGFGIIPDVNPLITASDNVTTRANLIVSQLPSVGTAVVPGTYNVTVVVKDEAGNFAICQKTIVVVENPALPNNPPSLVCGAPITVTGTSGVVPNVVALATASDDFTPANLLVLSQSPVAGTTVGVGTQDIAVTVVDQGGKSATCITKFIVQLPNQAPTIDCGAPFEVVEDANGNGAVPNVAGLVTVSDDYTPIGLLVITQSPAAGTLKPKGTHLITVTVQDQAGLTATCTKTFIVKSRRVIPTVDCALGGGQMWPPNHRLVTIDLTATATDIVGALEVRVYSDEDDEEMCGPAPYPPDEWDWDKGRNKGNGQGWGDGNFSPDTSMSNQGELLLRSERRGDRDGRVYLVVVKGTSITGDTAYCVGAATVPHDQSEASRASVCAQAAAAIDYFAVHGTPPPHYVVSGDGPVIGKKDGPDEPGNSPNSAKIFKQRDCCPTMILKF